MQGISNYLDYRWKHPRLSGGDGPSVPQLQKPKGKLTDNPLHLLLCNVLGVDVTHSHANMAAERWAKENQETFKAELQQEVGESGR